MTIRRRLCGIHSFGFRASEELVEFLKTCFKQLQLPFELLVRSEGIRYSFLNYNFLFRRFFDLYGCSHYGVDFPPLKSKKKREDTVLLYIKLIGYVKWPYINRDAALFGEAYGTSWDTLKQRCGPHPHPTALSDGESLARGAHADAGVGGLRRGGAPAPGACPAEDLLFAELPAVHPPQFCFDGGGDLWDDHDDSLGTGVH